MFRVGDLVRHKNWLWDRTMRVAAVRPFGLVCTWTERGVACEGLFKLAEVELVADPGVVPADDTNT